jgi:hypothetical protein
MLVAKTNNKIEKNISAVLVGGIISKLKLESKVTRVRDYPTDRACIYESSKRI